MKYIIYLFLICSFSCSGERNAMPSPDTGIDFVVHYTLSSDVEDIKSDIPTFPDPNREGGPKCQTSLDCKRFEFCAGDVCSYLTGCGWYGQPPDFGEEKRACIIDKHGTGRVTGPECETDAICPKDMPYCYLRGCQSTPPCKVDADCEEGYCDYETWCTIPAPCEKNEDCPHNICKDKLCQNGR